MSIKTFLVISHLDSYLETALQLYVKVYQVWINIIQNCTLWPQTEWRCQAAAEGLDVAS